MSILKLPPMSIELPVADPQSTGGAGAPTPEAPFAAVLHDEVAADAGTSNDATRDTPPPSSEDETATEPSSDPSATVLAALLGGAPPAAVTAIVAENVAPATAPNLPAGGADSTADPASPGVAPATGAVAPIPGASATVPAAVAATPAEASTAAVALPGTPASGTGAPGEPIAAPTSAGTNPQSVAPIAVRFTSAAIENGPLPRSSVALSVTSMYCGTAIVPASDTAVFALFVSSPVAPSVTGPV